MKHVCAEPVYFLSCKDLDLFLSDRIFIQKLKLGEPKENLMLIRSSNKRILELTQAGASKKPLLSTYLEDSIESSWTGKD